MEHLILENTENSTPFFVIQILKCPRCGQSWSADYSDYRWMRDDDAVVCCCGTVMCHVDDLKED